MNYGYFTYYREKAGLSPNVTDWTKIPEHQGSGLVTNTANFTQYVGNLKQGPEYVEVDYTAGKRVKGVSPVMSSFQTYVLQFELYPVWQNHGMLLGYYMSRSDGRSFGVYILDSFIALWHSGSYYYLLDPQKNKTQVASLVNRDLILGLSYNADAALSVVVLCDATDLTSYLGYVELAKTPYTGSFSNAPQAWNYGVLTGDGLSANGQIWKLAISSKISACISKDKYSSIFRQVLNMM